MSAVVKRSVTIRGHRTSVSLERAFFEALHEIAAAGDMPFAALVASIDAQRSGEENLSSALRLFVLDHYRARAGLPHTASE